MNQYLIKVLIEDKNVVYRDLLINPKMTLEELHHQIKKAFGFKGNEFASFIKEDDTLGAEIEIPLENLGDEDVSLMKEVKVQEVISKAQDQLVYTYDYAAEWKFFIELIEVQKTQEVERLPQVVKQFGTAPKESDRSITGEDAEVILLDAILGDNLSDDEFSDDFDSFDEHDSLDDYPDYL